jgi:hypothetical protein
MARISLIVLVVALWTAAASAMAAEPPLAEKYLHGGQFRQGEEALLARLASNPTDDQARFGLGALQFLDGVQHLGQSLYRYGLRIDRARTAEIPFLRLPVGSNPNPEVLTYPKMRGVFQDFINDMQKAENTLAGVRDEQVKLPLHLGPIRLDFEGNGKADTSLSVLIRRYMGSAPSLKDNPDLLVVFDRGDVAWLRGYCHLLMALAEIVLAYDAQELFDCTAHIVFARVETPHKFLKDANDGDPFWGGVNVVDMIALVHLIRLPVREPARLKAALGHLERTIALSRESWKFILAETDDDHEWIPNPHQTGVLGTTVSKEMIDGWLGFMDEMEAILAGKRLIGLWRGKENRGINVHRVFTEPRAFDLVLWIQGTAATPYLEEGPVTRPEVWNNVWRVFDGQFVGFAIWFN